MLHPDELAFVSQQLVPSPGFRQVLLSTAIAQMGLHTDTFFFWFTDRKIEMHKQ